MDRNGDIFIGDNSPPNVIVDGESIVLTSNFFLDRAGEVVLTLNSHGLSWKFVESTHNEESYCLGIKLASKCETSITFSDLYAVEFNGFGLVHESGLANTGGLFFGHSFEMYRFKVHAVKRSKSQPSLWAPFVYTFGHKDLLACQLWVNRINAYIHMETGRPKSLLVFVNPRSGKGNGCQTWEAVAPIFSLAKVKTKLTVTERAGHAFGVMTSISNTELSSYDGVIVVGGDGFFNEVLNGILLSRHKAPYPPTPPDFVNSSDNDGNILVHDSNGTFAEPADNKEDESPLLSNPKLNLSPVSNSNEDSQFSLPNERFRFGIIPAGSTDAIVICTTGARDPLTSALHIVLGKRVCLDIAQIVRWKATSTSKDELSVRYAASFAGYGFYGDVITESEKYRWMGPVRYDYAGTMVFLKHRSYEAEVAYLDVKSEKTTSKSEIRGSTTKPWWGRPKNSERVACRANCSVCNTVPLNPLQQQSQYGEESKWLRSEGRFLSVGAAVISCRNEKAPDGLVADAHLADGFLHLILIKDCPRALYLWHLTQLTRKGGSPLNFEFVEHHNTRAFTFTSSGKESVWNVDGELFQAHQLSAQVFRGLINLFATGPQV